MWRAAQAGVKESGMFGKRQVGCEAGSLVNEEGPVRGLWGERPQGLG